MSRNLSKLHKIYWNHIFFIVLEKKLNYNVIVEFSALQC